MKYKLKDKSLQNKLDEISDGDFTKCLEYKSERFAKEFDQWRCANVRVDFGKNPGVTFSAILHLDDLEEVHTYDPSSWNPYPDVKPPEGVQMRCITQTGMGFMLRYVKGDWLDNRNDIYDEHGLEGSVVSYRPWDK